MLALAAACLDARPEADLAGIDNDPGMLRAAAVRLAAYPRVEFLEGDFLKADIPACDAIVACISLHHVRTPEEKRRFYGKCHTALRRPGLPLDSEIAWLREAGFAPEVLWRKDGFAVLAAFTAGG